MRIWLAARATGITTFLLLTAQVVFGLILSHPTNQSTWKLSKRLFPWHENLLIFVLAFVAAHVLSLIADPYAGVVVAGAFVPGLSSYAGGRPVHHLLDPATGEPGGQGLLSVTVAGPDPAWAEVWSKTLFLEGRERIAKAARRRGLAAWWINESGDVEMTPAARLRTAWAPSDR